MVRDVCVKIEAHFERVVIMRHDPEKGHEAICHQVQFGVPGDKVASYVRF